MRWLCLVAIVAGTWVGCSAPSNKSAAVSNDIRRALDQAQLNDVSASQDRDKGVVTLSGHVVADGDKARAESIARSLAPGQVLANEIAVRPPGLEHDAKTVGTDLDRGISANLDAALIKNGWHDQVKYSVTNSVATLTGDVNSERIRDQVEKVAANVPNVRQVVNELQVKDQKATSR